MEKDSFLSLNLMRSHKKKWHFQTQNCPAFCLKILCWTVRFGLFTWTKRAFSISACGTAPRDWGIGIPSKRRRRKTALFFVYYILRITQMYYKPNLALSFPLSYGSLFSYRSHTLCRKLLIFFRLEKNFRKCHSYWKLFLFYLFWFFLHFFYASSHENDIKVRRPFYALLLHLDILISVFQNKHLQGAGIFYRRDRERRGNYTQRFHRWSKEESAFLWAMICRW